ncbi:uncharacterized protein [Oscarella lobularis]|uniref:uncharacterized protein isoform X2 n=1 Tax=Oscarella lobularis TaxID=121494 RepID=UPI003313F1F4
MESEKDPRSFPPPRLISSRDYGPNRSRSEPRLSKIVEEEICSESSSRDSVSGHQVENDAAAHSHDDDEEKIASESKNEEVEATLPASTEKEEKDVKEEERAPSALKKLDASVLVSTARKWKSRTIAQKMLANRSIAQNNEHQETLDRQVIRACTEIPKTLFADLLDDAIPIVQKAVQMYRHYLGPDDALTLQGMAHIEALKRKRDDNTPDFY